MTTREIELKALMLASLDGDAASHRALLEQLSRRLRAYYKGKLGENWEGRRRGGRPGSGSGIGDPLQAAYLRSR
jgi:hypothetical protein